MNRAKKPPQVWVLVSHAFSTDGRAGYLFKLDDVYSRKLKGFKTYFSLYPDEAITFPSRLRAAKMHKSLELTARQHTYPQNLTAYGYTPAPPAKTRALTSSPATPPGKELAA